MGRIRQGSFSCLVKSLLPALFIIFTNYAFGQSFTLNQFLKSSLDDPYYKSFDLQDAYLNQPGHYRLPWLEEFQFRYRDNEFQNIEQRYALRLEPGNPWQIGQNKKYFQGIKVLKSLEQKMALKEILKERYEAVIEYWTALELAELVKKQKDKRVEIGDAFSKKAGSPGFDPDQYLNSQIDIISKEADWHETTLERDIALSKIVSGTGRDAFELANGDLISVDQIKQFIESELTLNNKTELEFLKQRVILSGQKIKLEKTNVDLGFLQAMYTDRENKLRSPMGLAFGVNIPLFNNNKDEIAWEKMEQLEQQGKLERFQSEEPKNIYSTITRLNLHFLHYQKLDSLVDQFQNRGLNLSIGVAKNYDPVVELRYQEKMIQFDILKIKIKKEILLAWLNWLDYADKLQQRPLINYLSKELLLIEN